MGVKAYALELYITGQGNSRGLEDFIEIAINYKNATYEDVVKAYFADSGFKPKLQEYKDGI